MVVKAPEHLWNLNVLLKVFPSARIVMTHRNPLKAICSYSSMISMFRRTAHKTTCFKDLGPYVTDVFQKGLKRSYKARKNKSDNKNIIDVHCKNIQNNPITTFKSVCRKLKISVDDKASKNLKKWIKKKKNDSPDRHKYSYSTYGVSKYAVEKKFQFYDHKKLMNELINLKFKLKLKSKFEMCTQVPNLILKLKSFKFDSNFDFNSRSCRYRTTL